MGPKFKPSAAIAQQIINLREQLGLTQEELAHHIEATVSTVNRWENARCAPSRMARRVIVRFAAEHGVTIDLDPQLPEKRIQKSKRLPE